MIEQTAIDWLTANRFKRVGTWSPGIKRMQRDDQDRLPGIHAIYAFVADGKVSYIGKATHLRRRLRAYNRSLAEQTNRPIRTVHSGIRQTWDNAVVIEVWAYYSADTEKLEQLEARWIKEVSPDWNVSGKA